MNYSHAYHAGNFADIVKHAALLAVLGRMQAGASSLRVIGRLRRRPRACRG